jgi:hypothetical protein
MSLMVRFLLESKWCSVASQITWQYQGLKFLLLQVSILIAPLLNLLLTRKMIQFQHLRPKEVHCSIHRWDMDWRVVILHLEMDWQVLMVRFLLILHSQCCMVQVLPQVQLCFQCVYQMAVLYMFCNSLQGSSRCLWLHLRHIKLDVVMVAAVVEAVGDLASVEGDQEMIAVVTAATGADIVRIDVLGIVARLLALSFL